MKHSVSNPARQRTVFTVLLVWLLASGYSWANFCLMQENGSPWDASSASASPIVSGSQSSPGHAHADINHQEQGEGVEKACHDAFRDSTHGIVKSASRTDSMHADMFILVAPHGMGGMHGMGAGAGMGGMGNSGDMAARQSMMEQRMDMMQSMMQMMMDLMPMDDIPSNSDTQ